MEGKYGENKIKTKNEDVPSWIALIHCAQFSPSPACKRSGSESGNSILNVLPSLPIALTQDILASG